jgi:type IV pilus assembly protein PilB
MNFAAALRSFLRQDPDIIMVGEIRDFETAEIAIKAAQTGHMVLSTLHTNDAPQTINRLMNMGIAPYNITSLGHPGHRPAPRATDEIQKIVLEGGNAMQIAEAAQRSGVNDLRQSALVKAKNGVTSLAEINRVTKD